MDLGVEVPLPAARSTRWCLVRSPIDGDGTAVGDHDPFYDGHSEIWLRCSRSALRSKRPWVMRGSSDPRLAMLTSLSTEVQPVHGRLLITQRDTPDLEHAVNVPHDQSVVGATIVGLDGEIASLLHALELHPIIGAL